MAAIKIIVADDHRMVRKAWSLLLSERKDIAIIGEAENGKQVLEILKEKHANLVLLDLDMPEMDGFETTRLIKENFPFTKVIILTMHKEQAFLKKIFQLGASAFLTKNATSEDLFNAIDAARKGEKYVSTDIQTTLLQNLKEEESNKKGKNLSEREIEIIQLISQGLSSREISEKLFLSLKTVESHRGNIYKKLGVKNVAELLKEAKSRLII